LGHYHDSATLPAEPFDQQALEALSRQLWAAPESRLLEAIGSRAVSSSWQNTRPLSWYLAAVVILPAIAALDVAGPKVRKVSRRPGRRVWRDSRGRCRESGGSHVTTDKVGAVLAVAPHTPKSPNNPSYLEKRPRGRVRGSWQSVVTRVFSWSDGSENREQRHWPRSGFEKGI
jgi:hypothetical protein